jgi:hypothetical protein
MNKLKMNLCVSASIFSAVLILVACDSVFAKDLDEKSIREACVEIAKPTQVKSCINMVRQWELDIQATDKAARDYDRCRMNLSILKTAIKHMEDGGI